MHSAAVHAQSKKGTEFDTQTHDFGTVKEGELVKHRFVFTNFAKKAIEIRKVNSMCGCTVPKYTLEPVKTNQKGFVDVEFNSTGFPGRAEKIVNVFLSDDTMVTLVLTGMVQPQDIEGVKIGFLVLDQQRVDSGTLVPNQFYRTQVKFQVKGTGSLKIVESKQAGDIKVYLPAYTLSDNEIGSILVMFRPDSKREFGQVNEKITLITDHPSQPEIQIELTGAYVEKTPNNKP